MIPGSGAFSLGDSMNRELNQAPGTPVSLADSDLYRMMNFSYSMANARARGLETPTPGGNGYAFASWPTWANCFLTVYGDGRIIASNGTNVYWWREGFASTRGQGMQVYCAVDYGTILGDPTWTWLTINSARQWYVSSNGGFGEGQVQLYFRNGQVGQSSPGAWYLAAETS